MLDCWWELKLQAFMNDGSGFYIILTLFACWWGLTLTSPRTIFLHFSPLLFRFCFASDDFQTNHLYKLVTSFLFSLYQSFSHQLAVSTGTPPVSYVLWVFSVSILRLSSSIWIHSASLALFNSGLKPINHFSLNLLVNILSFATTSAARTHPETSRHTHVLIKIK